MTWRDPRPVRVLVWSGLVLMVASLVLHKVGLASDSSTASDYTWAYQITGMIKHGAELGGWMLLATGVAAGIEAREAREVSRAGNVALKARIRRPVLGASARELARRARP